MPARRGSRVRLFVLACCAGISGAAGVSNAVFAASLPEVRLTPRNAVPGCVTPQRLTAFLQSRNPKLNPRYVETAAQYAKYGEKLGVRWDIGFFQMMVETANLTFRRPDGRPGDVAPEHNNFAGLGAVGDGQPGETFISISHGVRGHLEHVLHYSGAAVAAPIAERTRKVQVWRVLENWHNGFDRPITYSDLARRWAPHTDAYLTSIEYLARTFQNRYCGGRPVLLVETNARQPSVAETAWRFEKSNGSAGTAGTIPPTGQPDFRSSRTALGVKPRAATRRPPKQQLHVRRPAPVAAPVQRPRQPVRMAAIAKPQGIAAKRPEASRSEPLPSKRAVAARPKISADDRIRQLISDRKVLLRTHVGVVVPIVYEPDGRMSGQAGSLSFFLGASRDRGKWWIKNGKLCQKWHVWLDRDTYCIKLTQRRGKVHWQSDDGKSGTARIVSR